MTTPARCSPAPRLTALLSGQRSDGGFGVHPYRKWTGAHWRLVSLAELAIPPGEPRAVAAAGHVLAWLAVPGLARPADRRARPRPRLDRGKRPGRLLPARPGR